MENKLIDEIKIIGISIRTTNENAQAAIDIPALWQKFMSERILEKIPNKLNFDIYSVYTEYESDFTKPYTTVLGCSVATLENIPEGMVGISIQKSNYTKFTATGKLSDGIVYDEWVKIWGIDLKRTYKADFEIYGQKAQNPENAEVDIFIGIE